MCISVYFKTICLETGAFTLIDSTRKTVFNAKWLFKAIHSFKAICFNVDDKISETKIIMSESPMI